MNILNLYDNNKIDKEEMFILYILKENNVCDISKLIFLFKDATIIKDKIESLYLKKLININWDKNQIYYNQVDKNEVDDIINKKNNNTIEEVVSKKNLTIKEIDKVRVILNRELLPFELEKLKKWHIQYDTELIIDAVYKSALKNIDNFNYIEKVLQNQDISYGSKIPEKKEKKVQKNFDFFS